MPKGLTVSPAAPMPPSDGINTDPPGHFSFDPKPKRAAQHVQTLPTLERERQLVRVERVTSPHHQTACLLAWVIAIGIEAADLLAHEVHLQHLVVVLRVATAGRQAGPTQATP